jgi:hypothetical protein
VINFGGAKLNKLNSPQEKGTQKYECGGGALKKYWVNF